MTRSRPDRCPGVLRPWPAADGLLVRLRLPGGQVPTAALRALLDVAERHGTGRVAVTSRANLQVRGLPAGPGTPDRLRGDVLDLVTATGLVPSTTHDLVRNVMASPQTGLADGHADVRPLVAAIDRLLRQDPATAALPGRFLLLLDDGRGDLLDHPSDLAAVALPEGRAQLRVGEQWSSVVPRDEVPGRLVALARAFLRARGTGPAAPWHVSELPAPLARTHAPDPDLPAPTPPLGYGQVPGGYHQPVPEEGVDRALLRDVRTDHVVITPWRGVLVPAGDR